MTFSGAFVKPFRPAFDAGLAAASVPWYLAGGAPTPIAVYEPKGAADLAASYVNLVTPGTYNAAPGVAPTFDAATGWTFNGSSQYLTTGIIPASGYSILIRFSGVSLTNRWIIGAIGYGSDGMGIVPQSGINISYRSGGLVAVAPTASAGVFGIGGDRGYRNGTAEGAAIAAWGGVCNVDMYIGTYNNYGGPATKCDGSVQAVAIWDTSTGHATWMPAVMAACKLI